MKNDIKDLIRQMVLEAIAELKQTKEKKKDVTGDGEADFTDVMASRMIASGMPTGKAIKKAEKTVKTRRNDRR
jgi:hypothetical protein